MNINGITCYENKMNMAIGFYPFGFSFRIYALQEMAIVYAYKRVSEIAILTYLEASAIS